MKSDTLLLNSSTIAASANSKQTVKYQFVKTGTEHSVGFLDNFLISLKREIALYGDQTVFTLTEGLINPVSTVEVQVGSLSPALWDVTDPLNCRAQVFSTAGTKVTFNTESNSLKNSQSLILPGQWPFQRLTEPWLIRISKVLARLIC